MKKEDAITKLTALINTDITLLEKRFPEIKKIGSKSGKQNKGWFGQLIERAIGLEINSSRNPNGGSWELKSTSFKKNKKNEIIPKETLAITMVDEFHIKSNMSSINFFEDSHFWTKFKRMIIVIRLIEDKSSKVININYWDINNPNHKIIVNKIKEEYLFLCNKISSNGLDNVHSDEGTTYLQIRTKGSGGESKKTKAFYLKKQFLKDFIGIINS